MPRRSQQSVMAVKGQGQTGTLVLNQEEGQDVEMFTGGRMGCCDHGSEEEGKTVGNNLRAWWKRQNKKLEQGNLKRINIQEIA
jgi:hypothetical protein